jgi:hypothetical protein
VVGDYQSDRLVEEEAHHIVQSRQKDDNSY